ncbi:MAG: FAD-binding protein [Alphaproteobacteria bacterium]
MATELAADVLIIGAGGAGMYAALAAARAGASVILLDKSLIGRSGATVMAQMTVAAAIGHQEADDWRFHLRDTIAAGRGLVHEPLARVLCENGPIRILEMEDWKVGWARAGNHIAQVHAPGHDRPRCVYADFLNTGPAVSRTLRAQLARTDGIRRIADLIVADLIVADGQVVGAVGLALESGHTVTIAAKATIIATGGLTKLYARNSASTNMGGDGYALALRAGAELVDMEFVQFFPIGHLAPRLIGMDPIMWDPFRYKLGGRLLNGEMQEFTQNYGTPENDKYVVTRDVATYAILQEVAAGRGSPHGGAYLSFQHIPDAKLREAFGPVIDRLAANGIDLTQTPIEVSPIAHYHMGGIRVDEDMASTVPGLFAAGEALGGPNGANRLSGNAITEALVFGERAGRSAAALAGGADANIAAAARATLATLEGAIGRAGDGPTPTAAIAELQQLMQDDVGPFRTAEGLERAVTRIGELRRALPTMPTGAGGGFDMQLADWLELRNMLLVADCVARAALARDESRGAHQRSDYPTLAERWEENQVVTMDGDDVTLRRSPVPRLDPAILEVPA